MRRLCAATALLAFLAASSPARAGGLFGALDDFGFGDRATEQQTYDLPDHTNRARSRAPARRSDWHPQDWIDQRGSATALINGFYDSGILHAQYINDKDMRILEIGPHFYHLGRRDRRRVADVISYTYRPGTYYLKDWYSRKIIASYTPRYGLTRE